MIFLRMLNVATLFKAQTVLEKPELLIPAGKKEKRGGFRYIYVYFEPLARIYLLLFYGKGVKDDLTKAEKKIIADSIKRIKESFNGSR